MKYRKNGHNEKSEREDGKDPEEPVAGHQNSPDLLVSEVDVNLPPLRSDVEMIPVTHEEKELVYFHDPQGYLPGPIALDKQITALLPMLNGQFSIRDICTDLKRYGNEVDEQHLLSFVRQLDEARLLLSPWFRYCKTEIEETFERNTLRPPVCAGITYPPDGEEIREMLDDAFASLSPEVTLMGDGKTDGTPASKPDRSTAGNINGPDDSFTNGNPEPGGKIRALYAPHIDLRVGMDSYVRAFRPLAGLKPGRVVFLATSHYAGSYFPLYDGKPFITTRKDFETPLGTIPVDHDFLDILEERSEAAGCSFSDRAHRNEHSIELHLIFLQYLWSHPFSLVPVLVGSLEELYYMEEGNVGNKVESMAKLLKTHFAEDADTLFLISGDLAHVGEKFGDPQPAAGMFEDIRGFDRRFLDHAANAGSQSLLHHVGSDYDPYRICGFPPLYTALRSLCNVKGTVTSYQLWDERERESAVTFGSVLFRALPAKPV